MTRADGDTLAFARLGFVVQQHAARRLHYDFRLESEGVLCSWAVPKGPSYDSQVRRLALLVDDHPLDHRDFEGRTEGGRYGPGAVIVWDAGTYDNLTEHAGQPVSVHEAIRRGHLSVLLEGQKLRGGWSLTRVAKPGDRQDRWILVKRKDGLEEPRFDVTSELPASVQSGRTLEELLRPVDARSTTGS